MVGKVAGECAADAQEEQFPAPGVALRAEHAAVGRGGRGAGRGCAGISHTYKVVLELDKWVRRRVRLYYWKAWKSPRTRRRHLLALGIKPEEVRMASRSRKGYWRLSGNGLVQRALSKRWLEDRGVPELRSRWIALHYGEDHAAQAARLS